MNDDGQTPVLQPPPPPASGGAVPVARWSKDHPFLGGAGARPRLLTALAATDLALAAVGLAGAGAVAGRLGTPVDRAFQEFAVIPAFFILLLATLCLYAGIHTWRRDKRGRQANAWIVGLLVLIPFFDRGYLGLSAIAVMLLVFILTVLAWDKCDRVQIPVAASRGERLLVVVGSCLGFLAGLAVVFFLWVPLFELLTDPDAAGCEGLDMGCGMVVAMFGFLVLVCLCVGVLAVATTWGYLLAKALPPRKRGLESTEQETTPSPQATPSRTPDEPASDETPTGMP